MEKKIKPKIYSHIGYLKMNNGKIIRFGEYEILGNVIKVNDIFTFEDIIRNQLDTYPTLIIPLNNIEYIQLDENIHEDEKPRKKKGIKPLLLPEPEDIKKEDTKHINVLFIPKEEDLLKIIQ